MVQDMRKTKAQLLAELEELRTRVTELESAQRGQEAAEEKFREKDYVIESATSVIATADLDGKMTYVNPAFLETWGFNEPADVLGRPFSEFWLVEERLNEIIQLQMKLSLESKEKDVGQTFEILVEWTSKKSEDHLYGRTSQNKVVVFPRSTLKPGDYTDVRITGCTSATLIGEQQ